MPERDQSDTPEWMDTDALPYKGGGVMGRRTQSDQSLTELVARELCAIDNDADATAAKQTGTRLVILDYDEWKDEYDQRADRILSIVSDWWAAR